MSEQEVRNANQGLARKIILDLGKPEWEQYLADDVVFEYPYAPSIGYPSRIAGRAQVVKYLEGVIAFTHGLTMFDVENIPALDPNIFYNTYKGEYGIAPGVIQQYISVLKFKDGKLALQREYWDPTPFIEIQKEVAGRQQ